MLCHCFDLTVVRHLKMWFCDGVARCTMVRGVPSTEDNQPNGVSIMQDMVHRVHSGQSILHMEI